MCLDSYDCKIHVRYIYKLLLLKINTQRPFRSLFVVKFIVFVIASCPAIIFSPFIIVLFLRYIEPIDNRANENGHHKPENSLSHTTTVGWTLNLIVIFVQRVSIGENASKYLATDRRLMQEQKYEGRELPVQKNATKTSVAAKT